MKDGNPRLQWIEHNGKKILYVDYRGMQDDQDMIVLLQDSAHAVAISVGNALLLNNFVDAVITDRFMFEVERIGKVYNPGRITKVAIVGVTGVRGFFYSIYFFFLGFKKYRDFHDDQPALDWLAC